MDPIQEALIREIADLKKKRNAVILAHNYQVGEVQDIADFVGDSLELSRKAAQTQADVIVFCGVHFMAETASILSPQKTVLIPDIQAGCPMADMITAGELRTFKKQNPGSQVVAYVNTSAEVKAESDICCTSANSIEVVNSLPPGPPPIFVPDQNLGRYTEYKTGRKLILWKGFCYVHHLISLEDIQKARLLHPKAKVLAHPECRLEVLQAADGVYSTSGMCRYAKENSAQEMILGTEAGIIHKLERDNPGKKFYAVSPKAVCENMKKTNLGKVRNALKEMRYEVKVPAEIREKALGAVQRMIALGSK